ncbi:carbohydrate sulfotransferase 15-like isoform X2 [Apostichopus japonicus]|uniref:carbohydrate sulfotransferase 15-like isoform X2 n=1 Tax=Stichopus japonicus TaxID=307972 RepID=UPI003AB5EB27
MDRKRICTSRLRKLFTRSFGCVASFVFIVLVVKFRDSSIHEEYNKFKSYNGVVRILPSPSPVSNETVSNFKAVTVGNTKKSVVRSESYSGNQTLERKLNFTREYLQTVSPDIFKRIPTQYLPNYRSFCWFEEDQLWCLPYFYIIGFHKCGTTDIFDKLEFHPNVLKVGKEPHWWALRRAGLHRDRYSLHEKLVKSVERLPGVGDATSFNWYLNWFKYQKVLNDVENTTRELRSDNGELIEYHPKVFGDGSVSTLTRVIFEPWDLIIPNGEDPELLPYLMHAVQPRAKVIITVRDPVVRFRSMFGRKVGGSSERMHTMAVAAVKCATDCIANNSVRHCAYFSHCQDLPQIYLGIYVEFIRPWAMVYGKENLLISRMEDRIGNPISEFKRILQYLELEILPDEECKRIMETEIFNVNAKKTAMLDKTKTLLQQFYTPFNRQMAAFMNDDSYNFGY